VLFTNKQNANATIKLQPTKNNTNTFDVANTGAMFCQRPLKLFSASIFSLNTSSLVPYDPITDTTNFDFSNFDFSNFDFNNFFNNFFNNSNNNNYDNNNYDDNNYDNNITMTTTTTTTTTTARAITSTKRLTICSGGKVCEVNEPD
jgi:hypothetical protein